MTSVALLHHDCRLGQRLAETIGETPGLSVAGVARSLPDLRALSAPVPPDLLLVDLMLPMPHVRAALHEQRRRECAGALADDDAPRALVLAVSADDPRVIEALRRGADSYFAHAHSLLTLPAAIEQLVRGEAAITPQIARHLRLHFEAVDAGGTALADADRRLLQWLAEGFLVSEVARALRLSVHAVGVRIRALYRQLQLDVRTASRAQAVFG